MSLTQRRVKSGHFSLFSGEKIACFSGVAITWRTGQLRSPELIKISGGVVLCHGYGLPIKKPADI